MKPRFIQPNAIYLMSRRCVQRQFWLRPSKEINEIFTYCTAEAADRTGVQIHGICVLSNHHHTVVADPEARLPEFLGENPDRGYWEEPEIGLSGRGQLNFYHPDWDCFSMAGPP